MKKLSAIYVAILCLLEEPKQIVTVYHASKRLSFYLMLMLYHMLPYPTVLRHVGLLHLRHSTCAHDVIMY